LKQKIRLAPMALMLLLVPVLCFAELTGYQQKVVANFAVTNADKPVRAAYEARNAGRATPAQLATIRSSELVYEDLTMIGCVQSNLDKSLTLEDAFGKVVDAGQGRAFLAAAKAQVDADVWMFGISADATQKEQAVAAAMMLAQGAKMDASLKGEEVNKALRRRLTLNYYLSFATDGKCKPSPEAKALVVPAQQ
jgi:hypothetical protein